MPVPAATERRNPAGPCAPLGDIPPERAILAHLLDQHPRRLSLADLSSELGMRHEAPVLRRAVENLAAAALILREEDALAPAPSVIRFDRPAGPPLRHFSRRAADVG